MSPRAQGTAQAPSLKQGRQGIPSKVEQHSHHPTGVPVGPVLAPQEGATPYTFGTSQNSSLDWVFLHWGKAAAKGGGRGWVVLQTCQEAMLLHANWPHSQDGPPAPGPSPQLKTMQKQLWCQGAHGGGGRVPGDPGLCAADPHKDTMRPEGLLALPCLCQPGEHSHLQSELPWCPQVHTPQAQWFILKDREELQNELPAGQ